MFVSPLGLSFSLRLPLSRCCSFSVTPCFASPFFLTLGLGSSLQREASQKPQLEENEGNLLFKGSAKVLAEQDCHILTAQ